jgi:hypothetical protein
MYDPAEALQHYKDGTRQTAYKTTTLLPICLWARTRKHTGLTGLLDSQFSRRIIRPKNNDHSL